MQEAEDALAPLLRCLAGMLKNDGGGTAATVTLAFRLQGASARTLAVGGCGSCMEGQRDHGRC